MVELSRRGHTHAAAAPLPMQRGLHVQVQKPVAHNVRAARLLTQAARLYKERARALLGFTWWPDSS